MDLQQSVKVEVKDHDYMGSANINMLINGAEFTAREIQSEKIKAECLKIISNIVEAGQQFNIDCRTGDSNPDHSDSYKRRLREQSKEETRNKIGKEKNKILDIQKRIDQILAGLPSLSTGDPVLDYLQDAEIRSRMASESESTMNNKYMQSIESGTNQAFIRAMENDPISRDFVTDETRLKSRLAIASEGGSAEAADVKDLMLSIKIIELAAVRADKLLH